MILFLTLQLVTSEKETEMGILKGDFFPMNSDAMLASSMPALRIFLDTKSAAGRGGYYGNITQDSLPVSSRYSVGMKLRH